MRIKSIRAIPLYVPFRQFYGRPIQSAQGELRIARYGLVEIETDVGLTGIGEISSVFARHGELYCLDINEVIAPALIDEDARDVTRLARLMDAVIDRSEPAKAGIEMALIDLVGKSCDLPAYQLLGGKQRDCIPLSFSVMYGTPDEMGGLAAELLEQGFNTLKVKCGQSLDRDIAAVSAVRAAVGSDARVRVDANGCWKHLKTALRHIHRMADLDIELYEQPLPAESLSDLRTLRVLTTEPIMVDESCWSPLDAYRVISADAADVLNVYVSEAGGMYKAMRIFEMAELAGVRCTIGSMPELGVGTAAQIHLGIAAPDIAFASDVCGAMYFEADIIASDLRIKDGFAFSLEAPGLGVALDPDAVRDFRVRPAYLA